MCLSPAAWTANRTQVTIWILRQVLTSETGLTRPVGNSIRRVVWISRTVESLSRRRNVGVREALIRIVVHPARHLLARLRGREVRSAGPLVVVPCFVPKLEVGDVFLDEDLVEQLLTGEHFRCEPVIRALLIELR